MDKTETKRRGKTHNDALRQALLRLIEINIPSRFASEREMAEALGILPAHFSQMKNGHRHIGKESADRIEKGLQLGIGGLYRFQGDDPAAEMPLSTESLLARYARSGAARRGLVDLTLAGRETPDWITSSIRHQHKALLIAIADALENKRKRK